MFLPSLISLRRPEDYIDSPEDILSSSFGGAIPDDLQNLHGDPDTIVVYRSRKYGDIELQTADANGEEERRKFAHYLWNAGILMAELVGGRPDKSELSTESEGLADGREWWIDEEEEKAWAVKGEAVLELGAGVGLAGIVATLAGADEVCISDYPAPTILQTISHNVSRNVPDGLKATVIVEGHEWGVLDTANAQANDHGYTKILAADCFWMPGQHDNLAKSMLHFLSHAPDARVLCIAGFHTGRTKLAPFFEDVVPKSGLKVESIFEMDADGRRRDWQPDRDGGREDVGEQKKWLVIAQLRRAV